LQPLVVSINYTCSCTTSPVSLSNLQVSVGGRNNLQSTLQYGYEQFLEQVNLCEQLTSSDLALLLVYSIKIIGITANGIM
jgi:hypothetical protein